MLLDMLEGSGRNYDDPELMSHHQVLKIAADHFPALLGQLASRMIPDGAKVLVVHGSVGMITLEIMKSRKQLHIDHTDSTANKIQVLEQLNEDGMIYWLQ